MKYYSKPVSIMFSTYWILERGIKNKEPKTTIITLTALIVDGLEREYFACFKDFCG